MLRTPALSTSTVHLRPWVLDDARTLTELSHDEGIVRWTLIPRDMTLDAARSWITHRLAQQEAGTGLTLAIVLVGGSAPIGTVGIGLADTSDEAEIYYWLAEDFRGQGIADKAVTDLCAWAWEALKPARLVVSIHTDNDASLRLARRIGFRDIGQPSPGGRLGPGKSTAPVQQLALDRPTSEWPPVPSDA